MCDQIMLEPALRSQGLSWRSKGMSLATLDHAQWFHRDVNVGDWLLLVQDSPSSTGGRAMARAEVFDASGRLVSTIAQEGMVRTPAFDMRAPRKIYCAERFTLRNSCRWTG